MADLSITAASVIAQTGATVDRQMKAGETITAGQAVYRSSTTGKLMKADADSATAEARTAIGIALNGASDNQPLAIARAGDVAFGAILTANLPYFLSSTAGGIGVIGDVGAGEYLQQIGIAKSTSVMTLSFLATGVAN
jgi:hypothetical protein